MRLQLATLKLAAALGIILGVTTARAAPFMIVGDDEKILWDYVGNYIDQDFSILQVDGTKITDTGKRFKVPGHPGSARMSPH